MYCLVNVAEKLKIFIPVMVGPLVFCLAFGWMLLLTGKLHFNYIYGIGALGCVANYGLLTLMSTASVSFFGKFMK